MADRYLINQEPAEAISETVNKWYSCNFKTQASSSQYKRLQTIVRNYTAPNVYSVFEVNATTDTQQTHPLYTTLYKHLLSGTPPSSFVEGWQVATGHTELEMRTWDVTSASTTALNWIILNSGIPTGYYRVSLSKNPTAGGNIIGAGNYQVGTGFSIIASAYTGYEFVGWYNPRNDQLVSSNPSYSNNPERPDQEYFFEARFVTEGKWKVDASVSDSNAGTITGGGEYNVGTNATLQTTPTDPVHYTFEGWRNNITHKLTNTGYTLVVATPESHYANYTAVYKKNAYTPTTNPDDLEKDDIVDTKPTNWMSHGDTNLYAIFCPNDSQLSNFARWLYGSDFKDVVNAFFEQGILDISLTDIIISLSVLPVTIPSSSTKNIKVGWIAPSTSQGNITMNYTNSNVVTVDCGSLTINPLYYGALDYQTTVEIYLPFIGYQAIETYDAIGHIINPVYQVDLLTGDCICKISIDGSVKYQHSGNCAYSIPLSQVNNNGIISKGISGAIAGISLATGNPMVATSAMVTTSKPSTSSTKINRNRSGDITSSRTTTEDGDTTRTHKSPIVNPKEAIGVFTNMGNGIHHGGSLNGNTGYMSILKPFLNIVRPRIDVPDSFGKQNGYPCNKTLTLGEINGFTMVDEIFLSGFNCTNDELSEIEQLLKGGIVL